MTGRLYHGTRTAFRGPGGLLLPADQHGGTPRPGTAPGSGAYVHMTPHRDLAEWYARQMPGRNRPRVLTVLPLAPVEVDPSPYHGEEEQYRCRAGARVLRVELVSEQETERETERG